MRRRFATASVAVAFAAVLLSFLLYTRELANVTRRDAEVFTRQFALLFQASAGPLADTERLTDEALRALLAELQRLKIPAVITDRSDSVLSKAFLPFEVDESDPGDVARLRAYVRELDRRTPPLELADFDLRVHFGEPVTVRRLRWIPWLQAATLLALVGGGAWLVFTSFRSERERIWSAMARESAHQMGTPLSSLVGWLEQLESDPARRERQPGQPHLVREMEADVQRLRKVSRRFELIGRKPNLEPVSVSRVVHNLERYFSARLPTLGGTVRFAIDVPREAPHVMGNETLLEWALENLIKNSIDALAGHEGTIGVRYVGLSGRRAGFRISDSGPGVAPQVRNKLFEIGVTTKERGWGVGLSLTRRIIEDMHGGSIWLEGGAEGASFQVLLPVARGADAAA